MPDPFNAGITERGVPGTIERGTGYGIPRNETFTAQRAGIRDFCQDMYPNDHKERLRCRERQQSTSGRTVAASPTGSGGQTGSIDPVTGQYNPATAGGAGATTESERAGAAKGNARTEAMSEAELARIAEDARMNAPAGSLAAGLGEVTGLPELGKGGQSLVNYYMNQNYGLGANSATGKLAGKFLSPAAKIEAVMGYIPGNNIDAVNFGASLLSTSGVGAQLDPRRMISTIVDGVLKATTSGKPTAESVGTASFAGIASATSPEEGMNTLLSLMTGALFGTMPDQALENYIASLENYIRSYMNEWYQMSLEEHGQFEASGGWFKKLVDELGPTLGL